MKKNFKILTLSLAFGLIISCLFSTVSFASNCENIRENVLRMHVIANSDSKEDQELKLKVRDAVLQAGKEYFDGSIDATRAEEVLLPKKSELERTAKDVIIQNGFDYDVSIYIGKANFPTRTYESKITLPAGEYEAVNVTIGEGKGHNWWCVMFPPMCLPACESDTKIEDILTKDELEIVESDPKLEPRFKIIEIYEKIIEKFQ